MFERILQDIDRERNLVIDNEKFLTAVDTTLLLDEIKQNYMVVSINMMEAINHFDSDEEFAMYFVGKLYSTYGIPTSGIKTVTMSDIQYVVGKLVMESKKNPVLVIQNTEAAIGSDLFYDLISIIQGMFQDNMINEKNYGFQSVIIIGYGITDDLLSDHEYGNVYRKPWVSGELYHNYCRQ